MTIDSPKRNHFVKYRIHRFGLSSHRKTSGLCEPETRQVEGQTKPKQSSDLKRKTNAQGKGNPFVLSQSDHWSKVKHKTLVPCPQKTKWCWISTASRLTKWLEDGSRKPTATNRYRRLAQIGRSAISMPPKADLQCPVWIVCPGSRSVLVIL